MAIITYGILTVSDSRSKGGVFDKSGPALERLIDAGSSEVGKILKGHVSLMDIVPDEESSIREKLILWSEPGKVDVILTTGGTGVSDRDVTPEATRKVIDKEIPGISLGMLMSSIHITPMAMLSRPVCGVRNRTLIVNLPGSPKAATECLTIIAPALPHAVDTIKSNLRNVAHTHKHMQGGATTHSCPHKSAPTDSKLCLEKVAGRLRKSPYPMISVEEALNIMSKSVESGDSELVSVSEMGYGRILASDVSSKYDLPPFRASIKDGYAVIASDGKGRRKVLGGVKAGTSDATLTMVPGTCVRVNTGAPVPHEATAVIQVEDTNLIEATADGKVEKDIEILTDVKEGQDIRPIGCDIQKGELILRSGTKLSAVELGLLEACGFNEVLVTKLPKIGVLSTGDELQKTGESLLPDHVYDSNKITLLSILKEQGFGLYAKDMGIARDNEEDMVNKITQTLSENDVLITSGSVSMGDRDMLKPVLKHHFNATIHFGRVNMKPGKPTTFGTCIFNGRKKYLLCLPGNPVSATVTMYLFVLPLLKELSRDVSKPTIIKAVKLTSSYNLDPRPEYARATLRWDDTDSVPKAYTTGVQASSRLLSCRNANALIILPGSSPERSTCSEGDTVPAMLLGLPQYI